MTPFERITKRHQTLPKVDLAQGRSIAYSRSITRRMGKRRILTLILRNLLNGIPYSFTSLAPTTSILH